MKTLVLVAEREILEKKSWFLLALAGAAVILVLPLVPGIAPGAAEIRGEIAAILATGFGFALALVFGASLVVGPTVERRIGFYFSRPVGSLSLFIGKLLGGWLFVLLFTVVLVVPPLVATGLRSPFGTARVDAETAWAAGAFALAILFVMVLTQVVVAAARSGSAWALADFVLLLSLSAIVWRAWTSLRSAGAELALVTVFAGLGGLLFLALLVAGFALVASGRADLVRGHRAQSLVLWSILVPAVATGAGYTHWFLTPEPADLAMLSGISVAPAGSWVVVDGEVRRRGGWHAGFLLDTASGRFLRLRPENGGSVDPQFSGDGRRVAWVEFVGRPGQGPCEVLFADLDAPSPAPRPTGILFRRPWAVSMALSMDGRRLAAVEAGQLSLQELDGGKIVVSAQLPEGEKPSRARCSSPTATSGSTASAASRHSRAGRRSPTSTFSS